MRQIILGSEMTSQTKRIAFFSFIIMAIVIFVYYLTAYRTITWWNNAELATAAVTLGVAYGPGCLLAVLGGWIVAKLAVCGSTAFALNLFAAMVAAVTVWVVFVMVASTIRRTDSPLKPLVGGGKMTANCFGAACGALTLAFSETFWQYAVKLMPYIFTVFLTALIVWALIKWWEHAGEDSGFLWLFAAALLFGLDLSVHRTNFLLAPAIIIWMLIRRPRVILMPKTWLYGIAGLALGLAVHMIQIPMAAADPYINGGDPGSLGRFWNYVSLQQLGDSWLRIFPRNAPFWDVQVNDYLRAFSVNFFHLNGPVPGAGLLPGLFGVVGLIAMWRKNVRLTAALFILFLFASAGAVIYFNIPANFFRSMFRHYMPSFLVFSIWIAYGLAVFAVWSRGRFVRRRWLSLIVAGIVIIGIPAHQLARNYEQVDGSNRLFVYDYASNYLNSLDDDAILITFGDNDTFPLWYLQAAKRMRPDVAILNINLLNTPDYLHHIRAIYADLPIAMTADEIDSLRVREWQDSVVTVPVEISPARFGPADTTIVTRAVEMTVTPSIQDRYLLVQDQVLLHMIERNRWRRPVYFSVGGSGRIPAWIQEHLRFEGLVWKMLPIKNPGIDRDIMRENLLDTYTYRGFADTGVIIDETTRMTGMNYISAFFQLAVSYLEAGDTVRLKETVDTMYRMIPPDRLQPLPPQMEQALAQLREQADGP